MSRGGKGGDSGRPRSKRGREIRRIKKEGGLFHQGGGKETGGGFQKKSIPKKELGKEITEQRPIFPHGRGYGGESFKGSQVMFDKAPTAGKLFRMKGHKKGKKRHSGLG